MTGLSWYEVWADEGLIPPYVMLLMCLEENVNSKSMIRLKGVLFSGRTTMKSCGIGY
jgi:hypothetical protein